MRGDGIQEHSLGWSTINSISKEEARIIVTCIEQEEVVISRLLTGSSGNSGDRGKTACCVEQVEHDESGYFGCSFCGKKEKSLELLREHQVVHSNQGSLFTCNTCGCRFANDILLQKHLAKGHTGDELFQCRKCGSFFSTIDEVSDHVKKAQAGGDQHLLCNICEEDFRCIDSFLQHMTNHRKNQSGRSRKRVPDAEKIGEAGPSSSNTLHEKRLRAIVSNRSKRRKLKFEIAADYQRMALLKQNFEMDGELFRISTRVALWRQQAADAELISEVSEVSAATQPTPVELQTPLGVEQVFQQGGTS